MLKICKINFRSFTNRQNFRLLSSEANNSQETNFGFSKVKYEEKQTKVNEVFNNVAEKYDLMNDAMSFGMHRLWKNHLIQEINPHPGMKLIDVAGGTGDITFRYLSYLKNLDLIKFEASQSPLVTVCDINENMLNVGKDRSIDLKFQEKIVWKVGNAEHLVEENDNTYDVYTIAFGIRNCTNIENVVKEAYRVLKPGGRFMCLEFSRTNNPLFKKIYDFYSFQMIPVMGYMIAGDWNSYQYLVESIRVFPSQDEFASLISDCGFRLKMSRPEHTGPPELFYNDKEAKKYTANNHIIEIQTKLTERALELLALPDDQPCFLLDIGCGSGLSGQCLSDNGHYWTGLDISSSMLDVAIEAEVEGDLILGDMGQGIPFRAGSFDGAISISAIQWLCNVDKKSHNPIKRLNKFFTNLYAVLARGSRAIFQLYPETPEQLELITQQAMKAGFTGGVIVDYPNSTKAKKIFLCLFAGPSNQPLPKGLTGNEIEQNNQVKFESKREKFKGKVLKKGRQWILDKKERQRRQGKEVRHDTKYTGRKRPSSF